MIPLGSPLDDIGFDALLALARRRLPALAPEWTDYNYHDPGITILELLAWVADSQIYSLARNRVDERLAMARLLGAVPKGAIPGKGVLYPAVTPTNAEPIEEGTALKPVRDSAPRLEAAAALTILPVEIERLITRTPDGSQIDHTEANSRLRAPFEPFGPGGDGELWIRLRSTNQNGLPNDALLSLGFELAHPTKREAAPAAEIPVRITVRDGAGKLLQPVSDTCLGLQRTGVLVLSLNNVQLLDWIVVQPGVGYPIHPTLLQVAPNALAVEQRATFDRAFRGTGRPGQQFEFSPASLFDPDEPVEGRVWRLVEGRKAFSVRTSGITTHSWKRGRLDEAGPKDFRYALDERPDGSKIACRFGNGINGRKPGLDDRIDLRLRLSCGRGGEVRKPVEWVLQGRGTRWRNVSNIGGGSDAQSVGQAISAANSDIIGKRVLTSAQEILRALKPLRSPLKIERAEVEEGWEPGLRTPRIAATRTLVVGHKRPGAETEAWLRTIRRGLAGRIAIAERLIVIAPSYVPFQVAVEADTAPGRDRRMVASAIERELARRFRPTPPWPLGRDVHSTTVAGWVRSVEGVNGYVKVQLLSGGEELDDLKIGQGALPQYLGAANLAVREGGR